MDNGNRLEITVRNRGKTGVRGSVIRVLQPSATHVMRSNGKLLPSDEGVIRVLIPFIAPGEKKIISVVLGSSKNMSARGGQRFRRS